MELRLKIRYKNYAIIYLYICLIMASKNVKNTLNLIR